MDLIEAIEDSARLGSIDTKPKERPVVSEEKLHTLSASGAPLEQVLERLLEETNFYVVFENGLDPGIPVTVNLKDVTVQEGLDVILGQVDLCHDIDGRTLYISGMATRYFEISYVSSVTRSEVSVGGDVLGEALSGGSGSSSSGGSSSLSGKFEISGGTSEQSEDFWEQVESGIQSLISENGTYNINRHAGILMVTDRNAELRRIGRFVDEIQGALRRQVVIEARVVEVTLNRGRSYGIDWSAVTSMVQDGTEWVITAAQNLALGQSIFQLGATGDDESALINALGKQGDVDVLSNPRLNVMNSQTALISVGTVKPYWELTGVSAGAESGSPAVYPEKQTVLLGLLMGVTPYISSDSEVTLHVVPIVTDIAEWEEFSWEGQTLRAPNIDIRQTSTVVTMHDGETLVIGGLMSEKRRISQNQVPLLGSIPILGWLFKRYEETREKTELVVMITPRIVGGGQVLGGIE
jgi:MSHA biogenesis protein MshL